MNQKFTTKGPTPKNLGGFAAKREISKIRLPVESFFGHLKHLWWIAKKGYPLHQSQFDCDLDSAILLTNEHIKEGKDLEEDDYNFYRTHLDEHQKRFEDKAAKRKVRQMKWKDKKKAKDFQD